jgi:hypothetical protein
MAQLLNGDPDGLPVLQELRSHPNEKVRDWARVGIERIHKNTERGPHKWTPWPSGGYSGT